MSLRERDYRAILSVIDELETADDRPAFIRDTARLVVVPQHVVHEVRASLLDRV
jgi:hypothetical protein